MGANTFKEVVQKYSGMPNDVVDNATEANPLIGVMPFTASNLGDTHKYEEVSAIQAAEAVNLNASYPSVGADFNLKTKDLAFYAGTREVHVNTVDATAGGNLNTYLQNEMPLVFSQTLNNIEFDMVYNVLRPFAKDKGKLESATSSPSGDKYHSLYVLRFEDGQMVGKFNPERAGRNGVFSAIPLSNGARYKNSSNKSVYGVDIEMSMGLLPVNGRNISGIVNIDLADVKSTAAKRASFGDLVSDVLVEARPGSGGSTIILGNPQVISVLRRLSNGDKAEYMGIDRPLWDEVPMIGDWNLLSGTESPYTL